MSWSEILKAKLPKKVLPTNIMYPMFRNISLMYSTAAQRPFVEFEGGKLVNVRNWLKQFRAVIDSGYDAIIEKGRELEETVPLSSLTSVVAPLRNDATKMFRELVADIKDLERQVQAKINREDSVINREGFSPTYRKKLGITIIKKLSSSYDEVYGVFAVKIPEEMRKAGFPKEYTMALIGEERATAPTINPKPPRSRVISSTGKYQFKFDGMNDTGKLYFQLHNSDESENLFDDGLYTKRVKFQYTNSEGIQLPQGLREDIDMGTEGYRMVRKIMLAFERINNLPFPKEIVEQYADAVSKEIRDFPLKVVERDMEPMVFIDKTEQEVEEYIKTIPSNRAKINAEMNIFSKPINVLFFVSQDGNAPLKVIKTAVENYLGNLTKGSRTFYVTEEGKRASPKETAELEPETERLTEEMQEETGGGFYPALESYLESTGDKLSDYKYEIILKDREDASDISRGFKINLGETPIFELSYTISGDKEDKIRKGLDNWLLNELGSMG